MESTIEFGLSSIRQISVVAHDLESMTVFYREKLGMKFLFEVPGMAFFDCDAIRLMLSLPSSTEFDHPSSIIYFKVNSIHQAFESLTERGVKFEAAPQVTARMTEYDLWSAFFRDPENNLLALMAEMAKA